MEENNTFVSCMKIRGISILPPLITSERRKELLEYKMKALLLEESYRRRRLQDNISEGDVSKNVETEMTIISGRAQTVSGVVPYVPCETQLKEKPNLSIDITNVYECIPLAETRLNVDECESEINDIQKKTHNSTNDLFENAICQKLEDSKKPRLIRSNSYTLDNPSSILLDHLKRQIASACDQTHSSNKGDEYFESIQHNSDELTISSDPENTQHLSSKNNETHISDKYYTNSQPSIEVITTDITVQQINFTTPDISQEEGPRTCAIEVMALNSPKEEDEISLSTDPEIELKAILQQIPENYAKKIMQLIKEQKKQQWRRTQNYEYIKTEMLQSGDFDSKDSIQVSSPKRIFVTSASKPQPSTARTLVVDGEIAKISGRSESVASHITTIEKSVASSLNESQTLPLDISTSSSDSLDNFSLRTIRILEFEDDPHSNIKNSPNQIKPLLPEDQLSHKVMLKDDELKKLREREMQRLREVKAASIIGAYAKGYLVRRLMNTVKVKTIIQTIQDALVCALELQRSETIEEADVELHRRLIKLVSSACFEFHDIFFALSIPEQMDIIAIDREKVKKGVAIRTTHSSTDFHSRGRTPSTIRSSQSLTTI